ncbi:MAG: glycosyltransferase [Microgenomates group bacterium]
MNICFYSPYLTNLHTGGGEKHLFDTALSAARHNQVTIAISSPENNADNAWLQNAKQKYETFFGIQLSNVEFVFTPLGTSANFLKKLVWTKQFDCMYYVTDGSLFFSLAKQNHVHFQIPLQPASFNLLERVKLLNWKHKNANSEFTKNIIEKRWRTKVGVVHYPLISSSITYSTLEKKPIILHVGRFFKQLHTKRQDALVQMFAKLITLPTMTKVGLELHFIGAIEDKAYFDEVVELAKGLPIKFHTGCSREELDKKYAEAVLYWHATGLDVDESSQPEKIEHFGISTVEAMAAGCVPVVHGKGGQKEILEKIAPELLWNTKEEAVAITEKILTNPKLYREFQKKTSKRALDFGEKYFDMRVAHMFTL